MLAERRGERARQRAAFLAELADLLAVPRPGNSHASGYSFEFPVKIPIGPIGPGGTTDGRIDLYRRGCFVLEAKQFVAPQAEQTDLQLPAVASGAEAVGQKKSGPIRGSDAWDDAMWRAKGQAERYARHLPTDEPPAPFLLVVDVGHSIEVYADFTQAGRAYQPFPAPRSFRLRLADLRDDAIRERLRRIWLEPLALDPAKISAEVTREIAGYLAILAASLEKAGHPPRLVAEFLTRCLFCMFAEDVGLLEKESFRGLLESLRSSPEGFVPTLTQLFAEMQRGKDFSTLLRRKILKFNGGLFEEASMLPLDGTQLGILIKASGMQWRNVEPELETHTIDPHQFLGIELNPRAASIAELVLWIGYLQWHFMIHGERVPPEPILRAFHNIECRDAVLAWDGEPQPAATNAARSSRSGTGAA